MIPFREHCIDEPGLVAYLAAKTRRDSCCLYCGWQFLDWPAVLHHMLDKQHVRLYEPFLRELDPFFDYQPLISSLKAFFQQHQDSTRQGYEDYQAARKELFQVTDIGELRLANGKLLGNRLLKTYYQKRYQCTLAERLSIEPEKRFM